MIENVFSPEMMFEREKQLITALLDCAGIYYDINFTKNRILGNPIHEIDGVKYSVLEEIGKNKNCSYTEIVDYWSSKMPKEELAAYEEFTDIKTIKARYDAGERIISHTFHTFDVLGNQMLAEQKIILYEDITNGDLLGFFYISNKSEIAAVKQKQAELGELYSEARHRVSNLQKASVNVPGGYHRCAMEEGYPFLFVSKSFEQLIGYTKRQIENELDNKFINLVLPEDLSRFENFERDIGEKGNADLVYRIRRRDGEIRWVQDSSLSINWDGEKCLQCTVADITDFVHQQEQFAKERAEFDELAASIPCGYHRCTTDGGFKLDFVSESFLETVGYSREEVLGKPYFDLVAPEDRDFFMSYEPQLSSTGRVELVYRVMRKSGDRRWIKDFTMRVEQGGRDYYQCILADITSFVNEQEKYMRQNLELMKKKTMLETMQTNMPGGYHRCRAEEGCPFTFIGEHFLSIVGYTREEIEIEFGNLYSNLLWDEDKDKISTYNKMLSIRGNGNVYDTSVYRLKHKSGGYRWVTDSTMFVDMGDDSFFQASISDITEYIEGINAAKKEAEASNLAKSTFLFNASHDIRTPMNAIKGFAHIIKDNADNEIIVKEAVGKIEAASDTLMALMNDILDLARIERGKEEINPEAVNLSEHENDLYELFVSDMAAARISFFREGDSVPDTVLCDRLKLTRIIMNMLSNARKFTPAGGTVALGVKKLYADDKNGTYRFYVRDTGIGMSEEFQTRAFEQFERERSSTESGISGSGLGMAIIKKLVELMGGKVEIRSRLGEGTEISATLTFPLAGDAAVKNKLDISNCDFTGMRVLIVEDNEFNREIVRYMLESVNITVEEAENGLAAVNKLLHNEPAYYDLVLMDIQMPVMNGYNATKEIRSISNPEIASVPIIAMTANAFDEDRARCIAAGMNGHIGKPIDTEALINAVLDISGRSTEYMRNET